MSEGRDTGADYGANTVASGRLMERRISLQCAHTTRWSITRFGPTTTWTCSVPASHRKEREPLAACDMT
jgi:hypothetical protein